MLPFFFFFVGLKRKKNFASQIPQVTLRVWGWHGDKVGARGRGFVKVVAEELASGKQENVSIKKIVQKRPRGGTHCMWATGEAAWLGKEKRGWFFELASGGGKKPQQRRT